MNDPQIKVLLVEDEPAYADLHQAMLAGEATVPFQLVHARRFSEAEQRLSETAFDVILLDLTLPDRMGLATFTDAKALAATVPIVVLTGCDDDQLAMQALRNGAQDYLIKGQFDGKLLARVIRYAIERRRTAETLRQREEFFRLTTENMHDLIAVVDAEGRRLYNSPSYRELLGDPEQLKGTNSFEEVYPEDRPRVVQAFQETLATGIGQRLEYRLVRQDGCVRSIESQGSAICDRAGKPVNVVVVARDVTMRKETIGVLRQALSDLKASHEELKATQAQLIQSERLEAVSTFAAGVAHEVRNPLQAIILGVDYLASHVPENDVTASMVLTDMNTAVQQADDIIRGLLEFSNYRRRDPREEDLNAILEQALPAVESELVNHRFKLVKTLASGLPRLRLDVRTLKHIFINLFVTATRNAPEGGVLAVKTFACPLNDTPGLRLRFPSHFNNTTTVVVAQIEQSINLPTYDSPPAGSQPTAPEPLVSSPGSLGLTVLKKTIELHGGMIDVMSRGQLGSTFTIAFKARN